MNNNTDNLFDNHLAYDGYAKPVSAMTADEREDMVEDAVSGGMTPERVKEPDIPYTPQNAGANGLGTIDPQYRNLRAEDFSQKPMSAAELTSIRRQGETGMASEHDGTFWGGLKSVLQSMAHNSTGKLTETSTSKAQQAIMRGYVDNDDGTVTRLDALTDEEQNAIMDEAGANGAMRYFGSFIPALSNMVDRGEDDILGQWDRGEGRKYTDPDERRHARAVYMQELMRSVVSEKEGLKRAAETELASRDTSAGAELLAGLYEQGAYTGTYLAGSALAAIMGAPVAVGAVLPGLVEGGTRFGERRLDEYDADANGNLAMQSMRDDFTTALRKGAMRGAIAPAIEMFGGNALEPLMKPLGWVAKATLGKIPLFKAAGNTAVATAAGRAVDAWMKRMRLFGRLTGMQSMPVEALEEFEDQVIDAALGLDRNDSALEGTTAAGRALESAGEFMKLENLGDLAKSMLLMQVLQSGIAYQADRSAARNWKSDFGGRELAAKDGVSAGRRFVVQTGEDVASVARDADGKAIRYKTDDKGNFVKDADGNLVVEDTVEIGGNPKGRTLVTGIRTRNLDAMLMMAGVDANELKYYTAPEKAAAVNAWIGGMTEEGVAKTFKGAEKAVAELTAKMSEGGARYDFGAKEAAKDGTSFTIPAAMGADGKPRPAFEDAEDERGNRFRRMTDEKSGVSIDRYDRPGGESTYRVRDGFGHVRSAANLEQAQGMADLFARRNSVRNAKVRYVEEMRRSGLLRGVPVVYGATMKDVLAKLPPEDADNIRRSTGFDESDTGFHYTLSNGQHIVCIILDNNTSVREMNTTVAHEAGTHYGFKELRKSPDGLKDFFKHLSKSGLEPTDKIRFNEAIANVAQVFGLKPTIEEVSKNADAAEELWAYVTETMADRSPSVKERVVASLREWWRKAFDGNLQLNGDEIYTMAATMMNRARNRTGGSLTFARGTEEAEVSDEEARRREGRVLIERNLEGQPLMLTFDKDAPNSGVAWGDVAKNGPAMLQSMQRGDRSQQSQPSQTSQNAPVSAPTATATTSQPTDTKPVEADPRASDAQSDAEAATPLDRTGLAEVLNELMDGEKNAEKIAKVVEKATDEEAQYILDVLDAEMSGDTTADDTAQAIDGVLESIGKREREEAERKDEDAYYLDQLAAKAEAPKTDGYSAWLKNQRNSRGRPLRDSDQAREAFDALVKLGRVDGKTGSAIADDFDIMEAIGDPSKIAGNSKEANAVLEALGKEANRQGGEDVENEFAGLKERFKNRDDEFGKILAGAKSVGELVKSVNDAIAEHKKVADDWAGRRYKPTDKRVKFAGKGWDEGEAITASASSINEKRRHGVIASENRQIKNLRDNLDETLKTLKIEESDYFSKNAPAPATPEKSPAVESLKNGNAEVKWRRGVSDRAIAALGPKFAELDRLANDKDTPAIRWRRAKESGLFFNGTIEDYMRNERKSAFADGEKRKAGAESIVYRTGDKVVKFRDAADFGEDAKRKIALHNELFPETAYSIRGAMEDGGDRRIVMEQPYVDAKPQGGTEARRQIVERLKARFGAENVTTKGDIEEKKLLRPSAWFAVDVKTPNGVYHVTDLKNLNVGVDAKDGVGKAWDADIAFEPKDKAIGDNGGSRAMFRISNLYTGSAADYEKPSLLKVGTGEGSQVYGWGLYASNRREVADVYAKGFGNLLEVDGKVLDINSILSSQENDILSLVKNSLQRSRGDVKMAIEILEENKSPFYERAQRRLRSGRYKLPSPKIYEQTFFTNRAPGDESHLLKWYEHIGVENAKRINDQLEKEFPDAGRVNYDWMTGQTYKELTELLGSPRAASEFLARADIDGIKYPVDSYGGKTVKDGDKAGWNYVSFRDDNIRVDHKWRDGKAMFRRGASQVTPDEDAAYMDAVKRGDMATAARMVREAAAKAMPDTKVVGEDGLPLVAAHRTGADFTVFSKRFAQDREGRRIGLGLGKGKFYLSAQSGEEYKAFYENQKVMRLFVNANKLMDEEEYRRRFEEMAKDAPSAIPFNKGYDYTKRDAIIERLDKQIRKEGYDGIWSDVTGQLAVFSPSQIKSADPVTYDDAGNVIPLSQRFNAENPDIRFRRRYTPDLELQRMADLYGFTPEQADLYNRIVTGGSAQFFADTKAARDLSRRGTISPEEQAAIDATTQGSASQRTKGWFRFLTQKPAWNWLRERAQDSMISLRNLESRLRIGKDKSAYYAFDRAYGLAAEDKKRFDEEVLAPMKEELARKGLNDEKKYADFNMLLLALHGPERNRMIAERSDVLNRARQNAGAAQVIDDVLNGRRQLDDNAIDEIANLAGLSARDKARMKRDLSGSGASTAVWNRLMRDFTASGFYNECITPSVPGGMSAVDYAHEIAKRTRELLVSTGRLSRQQADLWERMSPNYMPLMSDFETETAPVQRFFGLGRDKADEHGNFDQYGNGEFNHAYGRATVADDPIAAAIRQYDEAVKRSRDNEARQKLAAIVRSNPNMGYVFRFLPQGERDRLAREKAILQNVVAAGTATPAQVAELRRIDGVLTEANRADFAVPTTWVLGENGVKHEVPVVSGLEGGASKPTSIVAFKEDGDLKFVKLGGFTQAQVDAGALSDRDALQVATAAKYQNMVSNALAKRMRTLTGWFSGLRTSFVPTFVFSNFLADTTQATLNLSATYGAEGAKKFWRYRLNSIKAAMDFLDGNYGNNPNQTLRYAQEWAANGGMIGGRSVETLREIRDAIKRDVRMLRGNLKMLGEIKTPADLIKALYGELKSGHPLNALRSIGQFAEYWNSVIEMSTRIASYATVRDLQRGNGKTDAENVADAVSYSRDVTVNFNRKGALGNLINAWWAFGNANMQDIQRSLHALGEGDATRFTLGLGSAGFRVGKAGLKMWGALTALQFVASALGHMLGDDPDDEKEGLPQFKYTPEYNKQSKLGVLWGPNIRGIMRSPTYFGASLYDVIFNRKSITEAAKENAALLFSNFVDFAGNTGEEINKAVPSVLRPAWEISQNKNFMGQPIYREPFFGDKDTTTVRSELGKKDTSALSKGAARALNWVTGGNRNRRGAIDIQPEKISAVAEWFGGGLLKDAREFAQTIADLASFEAPGVKQIPFLNRLGKPRYENSAEYYRAVEKYDAAVAEFDGFAADGDESGMRDAAKDAPYLADKRWNDELKTLKKLKTELQKREVKAETKEDYDAIHAMRMKTQYLFMHRLETPPQGDAEAEGLRTHNRLAERFVKRAKAEDRRAKKQEDREVERRKRGIFK